MALYVLSDTHLSGATEKPMDIFGERWKNHTERIGYFFEKTLRTGDTVVIPGDISWGMTLEEALPDLQFLNSLPGKKILMKGNHDYWWSTVSKIEKFFAEHQLSTPIRWKALLCAAREAGTATAPILPAPTGQKSF